MSNTFNQLGDIIESLQPENEITDFEEEDEFDDDSYLSDSDLSDDLLTAQQQWEESMNQITGLFNLVLFPLVGKVIGRRTAHIIWAKFANWWFI